MIDEIFRLDEKLFIFLNNLGVDNWDAFWLFMTHKFKQIPFYTLLLIALIKFFSKKEVLIILVFTVFVILVSDQTANFFKHFIQRPRPCQLDYLRESARIIYKSCGKYGFFSGHATNSMAIAVFMGLLLFKKSKKIIFVLICWSLIVGYSRVYVGVHYPLDVLIGFLVGGIFGYVFFKLHNYLFRKLSKKYNLNNRDSVQLYIN